MKLARSWNETATGIPLLVRIWREDPRKDEYYSQDWPDEVSFFESDDSWAGEALRSYFEEFPHEDFYGFVGDDVVLETPGGIEQLILEAGFAYIAYPNDQINRHKLCTHFCIGGGLVRTVGFLVPPNLRHHYLDNIWMEIGRQTGLLRYRPDVIFRHEHLWKGAEFDASYARAYASNGELLESERSFGETLFKLWFTTRGQIDITNVRRWLLEICEGRVLSDAEVAAAREEAVQENKVVVM